MHRLLAVVLLLCTAAVAAQHVDERRILTVDADQRVEAGDEPADAPLLAEQPDERLPLARQLVGVSEPDADVPASPTLEILARSFADNMSIDELREAIAFQESPSGRAFIAATRQASAALVSATAAPRKKGRSAQH